MGVVESPEDTFLSCVAVRCPSWDSLLPRQQFLASLWSSILPTASLHGQHSCTGRPVMQSSNKGNRTLHLPWPQPQAHPSSPSNQSSSSQPWGNLPARVGNATLPPFTLGIQVPAEVPGRGSTDEETIVEQPCPLGKCHGSSTRTIKNAVMVFTRSFFPVYFKPCFPDITARGQGAPPLLTEGLACRGCTRCSLYDGC